MREPGESATRCINTNCPARLKESILHFASRGVMNIDGVGVSLVDQLVDGGLVKSVADLYSLTADQIKALERLGHKSAANIVANIKKSKSHPLPRVISALGIRFVGERTSRLLAEQFGSLDTIAQSSMEDLQKAGEVGPKVADSIHQFFREPLNRELVERLRAAGLVFEYKSTQLASRGPLAGLTFVLTGTLSTMSREEAATRIERAGGKVSGTISRKTNYLVAGTDAGSKLSKARDLNIEVIDEPTLIRMLESGRDHK